MIKVYKELLYERVKDVYKTETFFGQDELHFVLDNGKHYVFTHDQD